MLNLSKVCLSERTKASQTHFKWYGREGHWRRMHLLYAAPTSKPWRDRSTGSMEKLLIEQFNCELYENCINRKGGGGDCPSFGNPHFVYVVEE